MYDDNDNILCKTTPEHVRSFVYISTAYDKIRLFKIIYLRRRSLVASMKRVTTFYTPEAETIIIMCRDRGPPSPLHRTKNNVLYYYFTVDPIL